jgi:CheY-like chemotaxis protein
MSILIVEDNSISAKVLEFNLQKNAYQTIIAQSAKEALEHLTSAPQIRLIIADIMMPEMDGLELLNKIKEQPEWKNIPVIMCSSLADVETVKKAVQAGCRHYLIKPVKGEQLMAKVREALDYEKPVLDDKREIIFKYGLNEETYQDLVRIFISVLDERIAWLEKRIEGETESVKSIDLLDLLENAIYFGAERIRILLEEITAKVGTADEEMRDSQYRLLLRELKILKDALSPPTPNETQSMKKEDKKNDSKKQPTEDTPDTSQKKEQTKSK